MVGGLLQKVNENNQRAFKKNSWKGSINFSGIHDSFVQNRKYPQSEVFDLRIQQC